VLSTFKLYNPCLSVFFAPTHTIRCFVSVRDSDSVFQKSIKLLPPKSVGLDDKNIFITKGYSGAL
jgi:hypothetical protein